VTILERDADVELPKELRKLKFNAEPGFDEVDDEREPGDVWEVDWCREREKKRFVDLDEEFLEGNELRSGEM